MDEKLVENVSNSGDVKIIDSVSSESQKNVPNENTSFNKTFSESEGSKIDPKILLQKEIRNLKRADYDKISKKFTQAYVIQNKKTGIVLEIIAASSVHACNLVGWRPRLVELIDVIKAEDVGKGNSNEDVEKGKLEEKLNVGQPEQPSAP